MGRWIRASPTAFRQNPIFFLVSTLAATVGLVLAILGIAMLTKRRQAVALGALAALAGAAAIAIGVVGWQLSLQSVDEITRAPGLTEADRTRLSRYHRAQASYQTMYGLAVGALPVVLGSVVLITGIVRRRRSS